MDVRRLAPHLAACALTLSAGFAEARPFTLNDFLARQSLNAVMMDPSERWLVVETTGAYDSATDYSLGHAAQMTIGRLDVSDLREASPPRRLFATALEYGYQPVAFSPSGDRLAVTRARGTAIELGVVELATGQAVWTGLTPMTNLIGRTVQWRGERDLVVLTRDPDAFAFYPAAEAGTEARIKELWAQTRMGGVGVVSLGSGRYLGSHSPPAAGALVSVDAHTGQSRPLARGEFWDLELSGDGRWAAVLEAAEDVQPVASRPATTGDPFRRYRLRLIELASGETWTPCASCEIGFGLLAWSPDTPELLVYAKDDAQAWEGARYRRIDTRGRRIVDVPLAGLTALGEGGASGIRLGRGAWLAGAPVVPAREPSGRKGWYRVSAAGPVNLSRTLPGDAPDLVSVAGQAALFSAQGRVWRIGPQGEPLSAQPSIGRLVGRGAATGGTMRRTDAALGLALTHARPPAPGASPSRIAAVTRSGVVVRAARTPPDETVVAIGPNTGAVVTTRDAADGSQTVLLRRDKATRVVALINRPRETIELSHPHAVRHRGPNGEALVSWLYPSTTATASHKAPLVIVPYPGIVYSPEATALADPYQNAMPSTQVLAGAGFSVLLLSMPLALDRAPVEGLADQILAAVAATNDAVTDTRRLGLFGHSYGGYAVLAAATQSHEFGAIVAAAASPDLIGKYQSFNLTLRSVPDAGYSVNAGWSETGQGRMGAPPWRDPDRYVRNSPYFQVERVTTPILFITGDMDGNPVGARAMFNALYRLGKDAILLDYFGEGHVAYSPGNIRDQYERVIAFFHERLAAAAQSQPASPRP